MTVCWGAFLLLLSCALPLSRGSLRQYILLTLSHVECTEERLKLSADAIIARLTKAFVCKSIVISKESHTSLGHHLHVGVWNESASKHTVVSKLRELLPEFEGRQLDVSFHKGWNSVCRYLLKEDKAPTVWGEESLDVVKERAGSSEGKRRGPDLVKLLRAKASWEEVLTDDNLVKKCLSSYSSVRNTFEDLQAVRGGGATHFWTRLEAYVHKSQGRPYSFSELKERYYPLWWLVFNLCRPRHLRQKQMVILGCPGTKKTNLVQILGEIFDVYFVSRRTKDFTGANKDYDLWVIDECSGYELDVDTLNMLLDGQRVSLDTKYGRVSEKTKNKECSHYTARQ